MARFDIYKYSGKAVPLVIDVQADLLSDLNTCAVIPLVLEKNAQKEALSKLKPTIQIEGVKYILMTTDIGTVTRSSLGEHVANVENDYRQEITEALDFLFQGF
ncbi:MAG: plasmid maintenance protein CcdB [Zetaproteobacteria bacterium]|nr:MAG: plasmid maintenance protein CcdB [Zetaproteobacteria bacterium]